MVLLSIIAGKDGYTNNRDNFGFLFGLVTSAMPAAYLFLNTVSLRKLQVYCEHGLFCSFGRILEAWDYSSATLPTLKHSLRQNMAVCMRREKIQKGVDRKVDREFIVL